MSFLSPTFLPFLVLASIPVILYLLFRRKRNDVDWGATYILQKTLLAKSKQNIWKQVVILALRTVFLALLVLGFARSMLPRKEGAELQEFPHGPGTLHRIVLLDTSRSMSAQHGSVSREETAKAVLRETMISMRAGDTFHLLPLCPDSSEVDEMVATEFACPIREKVILQALVQAKQSSQPADIERALRKAKDLFAGSPSANRQMILLTDFTRKDHPSIARYESFGEALAEMGVRTAALFLGKEDAHNLALDSLTLGTDLLLKGQPTQLYVTVMNYSEKPSSEGFLSLLVDGRLFEETACVLSPHQRKTFEFPLIPRDGPHHLEARLAEDAYTTDNRLERSVDVSDHLSLLLLHRDESDLENIFERDTEFFRRMSETPAEVQRTGGVSDAVFDSATIERRKVLGLSVSSIQEGGTELNYEVGYRFDADVRLRDQITSGELPKFDVVLCSEVDQLSAAARKGLFTFVRRGGGLILGVGPNTDAQQFNETFGELLPYPLAAPFRDVSKEPDYERFLNIRPSDITVELLREFEEQTNGNLADGRIYNHFRLELPEQPAADRVFLSLSNGDPVLLHRRYGKGSVLLWSSTLGGGWSSLPVHQAYLPLLVRLLNFSSSFKPLSRNLVAGQPIIHDVTPTQGKLFLTTPDFKLRELSRIPHGDHRFIRYEEASLPGVYELQTESGETLARFFVKATDAESDLRAISQEAEKELTEKLSIRLPADSEGELPVTVAALKESLYQQGEGQEVTTWFFLAVMLLFLLDAGLVKLWFS